MIPILVIIMVAPFVITLIAAILFWELPPWEIWRATVCMSVVFGLCILGISALLPIA